MGHALTVLDGGTGRELKRIGAPFRQPEWSALALLEGPEFVAQVHASYLAAGADVITTNSYALVPFHIGAERFALRGLELAELAGCLAREAAKRCDRVVRVAGSLPPICGSYRADWFEAAFARPILATLVAGLTPFIDHWQAETLSTIAEARLVREVLGHTTSPLWLSFTLTDTPSVPGTAVLRSGESVRAAVRAAVDLQASAVLFNCSQPEVMSDAVRVSLTTLQALGEDAAIEIGVYANAFMPQRADAEANSDLTTIRADLTPEGYLRWVREWIELGARIVGGCCGIGPEHIATICHSVRA